MARERPYSHYSREKTWAALYSQHINAGYVIVPYSFKVNSIVVIRTSTTPEETARLQETLIQQSELCKDFFASMKPFDKAPPLLKGMRWAVVLARSSEYYHYHLADDATDFKLVICGLHDSYLQRSVWEIRTNATYKPRTPGVAFDDPDFDTIRRTSYGHNILLGALICGDAKAEAFKNTLAARTRRRIEQEVISVQNERYHGRPLAFMTEEKRARISLKISQSLKRYHASKRGM